MGSLLRRAMAVGLRKGVAGSRPWLAVGIVALGVRVLRRLGQPKEKVLYRTVVQPGETFEITSRPDAR